MSNSNSLGDNYQETLENFKQAFEVVHQEFSLSQTLKIHVIFFTTIVTILQWLGKILEKQIENTMKLLITH